MSNESDKDIGADELSALFHPEDRPEMHDEYTRPAGVDPFVITKTEKELLVVYSPKNGAAFVDENIRINGECRVASGVLTFKQDDVKDFGSQNIGSRTFVLARQTHDPQGYYIISRPATWIRCWRCTGVRWRLPSPPGATISISCWE